MRSRRRLLVGPVVGGLLWAMAGAGGPRAEPAAPEAPTALRPQGAPAVLQPEAGAVTLPAAIPIFPLPDVMLFPGASRPLHIFEPRYRALVADALAGDRIIGMVMLQPGHEADYAGTPPIHDIGCAGEIVRAERLPDGRYDIMLRGRVKFRVTGEDWSRAYRVADVEALPEPLADDDRAALARQRPLLLELLSFVAPDRQPTPAELPDAMLVDGLAQFLGMAPADRLALLRQPGARARADALIALLDRGALSR